MIRFSKTAERKRNSTFEALRLVGILLVLCNHFFVYDQGLSAGFSVRWLCAFLSNLGGTGDVLFFGITAWFMCGSKDLSLRSSLVRVWRMEREVLWYSLAMLLFTLAIRWTGLGFNSMDAGWTLSLGFRSFAPLSFKLWWYPSSYAIFIIICPFLTELLGLLSARAHCCICVVCGCLCSILPSSGVLELGWSPLLFCYLYLLASYLRWHVEVNRLPAYGMVLFGGALGAASLIIPVALGQGASGGYMNSPQALPSLLMGFGLIVGAEQLAPKRLAVVDFLASGVFAVYLVWRYPSSEFIIAKVMALMGTLPVSPWARVLCELAMIVCGAVAVSVIDLPRRLVFHRYLDQPLDMLFVRIYEKADCRLVRR